MVFLGNTQFSIAGFLCISVLRGTTKGHRVELGRAMVRNLEFTFRVLSILWGNSRIVSTSQDGCEN